MDIIIIVIILVICCCCFCILGGGGYYYMNYMAPSSDNNTSAPTSASNNTSAPSSSDNTSASSSGNNTSTPPPLQIPAPIVTDFNAPSGEYSSNCVPQTSSCNCRMDFKVLYQVTVNGVKSTSPPSSVIGTSNNCNVYWNPTLYFTITNPPINISNDIKLILLTSRSGENNWYYSKVNPFTIEVSADKTNYTGGIKFGGATATFGPKYT